MFFLALLLLLLLLGSSSQGQPSCAFDYGPLFFDYRLDGTTQINCSLVMPVFEDTIVPSSIKVSLLNATTINLFPAVLNTLVGARSLDFTRDYVNYSNVEGATTQFVHLEFSIDPVQTDAVLMVCLSDSQPITDCFRGYIMNLEALSSRTLHISWPQRKENTSYVDCLAARYHQGVTTSLGPRLFDSVYNSSDNPALPYFSHDNDSIFGCLLGTSITILDYNRCYDKELDTFWFIVRRLSSGPHAASCDLVITSYRENITYLPTCFPRIGTTPVVPDRINMDDPRAQQLFVHMGRWIAADAYAATFRYSYEHARLLVCNDVSLVSEFDPNHMPSWLVPKKSKLLSPTLFVIFMLIGLYCLVLSLRIIYLAYQNWTPSSSSGPILDGKKKA